MDLKLETKLVLAAKQNVRARTTSLKGDVVRADIHRYISPKRLELEKSAIFNKLPSIIMHSSELLDAETFKVVDSFIGSLIVTRDKHNNVHVLHNSCRHRGAKLTDGEGCAKQFVCPYHAWSYALNGDLRAVPGERDCFPDLDKSTNGLLKVPVVEKYGFVWICPDIDANEDAEAHLDRHLGDMAGHLQWLQSDKLKVFDSHTKNWSGNWKLFAEGGLETYHFAYAHKGTIAPYFFNNIAVIDQLGIHFRVVMPTKELLKTTDDSVEDFSLHDYSHTLFFLLPNTALLVQKEHVDWISFKPLSFGETEITVTSLIPDNADLQNQSQLAHWQKNHEITIETLNEDWQLGASIQASLNTGVLPHIQYGKNEWALVQLNKVLDNLVISSQAQQQIS